ncbi:hypothetical protein GN958_ATG17949 [Phytophthora infestans]|uniref:Uncharacterized protein n=1 Tax=Phytophthora infestans TaxID=4787 RepID=A0A8S9TZB7_PHYIN|nr:hypothetical protein GN958_ATG17949 [Phytophthora infestans]
MKTNSQPPSPSVGKVLGIWTDGLTLADRDPSSSRQKGKQPSRSSNSYTVTSDRRPSSSSSSYSATPDTRSCSGRASAHPRPTETGVVASRTQSRPTEGQAATAAARAHPTETRATLRLTQDIYQDPFRLPIRRSSHSIRHAGGNSVVNADVDIRYAVDGI